MTVDFRLLGDVEVRVDGRVIDVGHSRQRCVLAVLLVDANRTVSVDALVDRVWADRPPQRARGAVYNYLSRLRQALVPAKEVHIERQSGGYVVTVDPMAVDVYRFQHLVAQAHTSADDTAALTLFDEALALWRGNAFGSLDTPWLNTVRLTLDRERFAAELERNDVHLRLGGHARLLGVLSDTAAAHPLDERLAGQLMLALYRSGRQADALRQFQRIRLRLADELGTDPALPLRQLHQQILEADPDLAISNQTVTTPARRSPERPAPRQLPAAARSFTGRVRELAQLDAFLPAAERTSTTVGIAVLSGTAGVGKTTLAIYWAHQAAEHFPDGQLYVNLRGFDSDGSVMNPAEAVSGFLDALGVLPHGLPAGLDAQAALYRSLLAGRKMLVLLDNAHDAEQVRPLLPGAPGCHVVITSRTQLTGLVAIGGAYPLSVDVLTEMEASELLSQHIGHGRVAAEPDSVAEITTRCARLPLALAIVAARAAARPRLPLEVLARELGATHGSLDAFDGGDPTTDVRSVFSWSYRALNPDTARLFRFLSTHPGPDLGAAAAASLTGNPPRRVQSQLAELVRAHLLAEDIPGRYTFHDLLRAYATEQALAIDGDADRCSALHRLLEHYLHSAHTAAQHLSTIHDPLPLDRSQPGVTPEDITAFVPALAWFTTERRALLAAVDAAVNGGFDTHAWQLAEVLTTFLNRVEYWPESARIKRAALAAAQRSGSLTGQARAHRKLGTVCAMLGHGQEGRIHLNCSVPGLMETIKPG